VPVADIVSGHEPELTPGYISTLAAALDGADAVVLAEPYLVRAVEQAVTEAGIPAPPVVLDAYNVEAALKERILPETELGQRLMRWTVAIEAEAVSRAAKVVACGEIDAADLAARYERSPSDVTVITNGAEVPAEPASQSERNHRAHEWLRRYHRTGPLGDGHTHLGLFVGSWHPPNVDAVWMLTELADALPHLLIVSAGSIGDAFYDRVVPPNMVFTGVITDASRRLLLRSAHVALNPMRLGSGTNLKLVEYLSNQIPTVSTPFGARGLDVVDGTHLRLAEPEGFAAAIDHVLTDADAAARMARAGRDLVATDLAWPVLADQLTDLVTSTAGIVL